MTDEDFLALVRKHTRVISPPLCPELCTREASALIPLWETVEALEGRQVEPPYWAYSWAGGQAVARYLLDHPETTKGRVVLDLGCGNGLASLAAARTGATRVLACDIDPAAARMAGIHAEENSLALEVSTEDVLSLPPPVPPTEIILAGDMFYARWLAERTEPWLREAARRGSLVIVGDPGRTYLPRAGLAELAAYEVPVPAEIESVTLRRTKVYRLEPA